MMQGVLQSFALYLALIKQLISLTAFVIILSSLDDLLVDCLYLSRRAWRSFHIYRVHPRSNARTLRPKAAQPMAILVPAWSEADVIGPMLTSLLHRLDYPDYTVYVATYPNDPATTRAAQTVAATAPGRVHILVTERPGPTTKADALNQLYAQACRDRPYAAFVLHDAEDVVHPMELWMFNHLIPDKALVQAPVMPLPQAHSRWIAGSYMDEFAEAHGKDMVVREWIGAALPSAGVGCAFAAHALARSAAHTAQGPFSGDSVTEDYELGVRLGGGRSAIVHLPETAGARHMVATREYFPDTLHTAVRQRARWLLGITLQSWDKLGWPGSAANRFMLARDRKALITAYATMLAYFLTAHVLLLPLLLPPLPPLVVPGSATQKMLALTALLLGWRLTWRALFTARLYGWREGFWSVPRVAISNIITFLAASRAIRLYLHARRTHQSAVWEKTAHRFPSAQELALQEFGQEAAISRPIGQAA